MQRALPRRRLTPCVQEDKNKQFRIALVKQTLRLLQSLSTAAAAAVLRAPEVISAATVHGLDLSRPTLLPAGEEEGLLPHVRWAFDEIAQGRSGVSLSLNAEQLCVAEHRLIGVMQDALQQPRYGTLLELDSCDVCHLTEAVALSVSMMHGHFENGEEAALATAAVAQLRDTRDRVAAAGGDGGAAVGELEAKKRMLLYYESNERAWGPFGFQWCSEAGAAVLAAKREYKESIQLFTVRLYDAVENVLAAPWLRHRDSLDGDAKEAWEAQLEAARCGHRVLMFFLQFASRRARKEAERQEALLRNMQAGGGGVVQDVIVME